MALTIPDVTGTGNYDDGKIVVGTWTPSDGTPAYSVLAFGDPLVAISYSTLTGPQAHTGSPAQQQGSSETILGGPQDHRAVGVALNIGDSDTILVPPQDHRAVGVALNIGDSDAILNGPQDHRAVAGILNIGDSETILVPPQDHRAPGGVIIYGTSEGILAGPQEHQGIPTPVLVGTSATTLGTPQDHRADGSIGYWGTSDAILTGPQDHRTTASIGYIGTSDVILTGPQDHRTSAIIVLVGNSSVILLGPQDHFTDPVTPVEASDAQERIAARWRSDAIRRRGTWRDVVEDSGVIRTEPGDDAITTWVGDTLKILVDVIDDQDEVVDCATATVVSTAHGARDLVPIDADASVLDGPNGLLEIDFGTGNLPVGEYRWGVWVTINSEVQTIVDSTITVRAVT